MAAWPQTVAGRTFGNAFAILSGEALSRLVTFVLAVIIARRFGAAALGQYGYALALASVLVIVPDFGLHLWTTREIASDPSRISRIVNSLHWLKFGLIAVLLVLTVNVGQWLIKDPGRRFLFYLLVGRVVLQTFTQAYMAIFKAFERMHYVALQQLASAASTIALAAVALIVHASLVVVVGCLLVGEAVGAYAGKQLIRRRFAPGRLYRGDGLFARQMFIAAVPIGVTAILQAFNLRIDVITLSVFASNAELGRFQAAAWFLVGGFLSASLLMTVAFPKISRLFANSPERARLYVESLVKHSMLLAALGSLFVSLAASYLLSWVFGATLAAAANVLRIIAAALPFMFLNTVLSCVFVAARRRAVYTGTLVFGACFGVLLGLFLAQRYGAAGAALADLVREFMVTGIFLYNLKRQNVAPQAGVGLLKTSLGVAGLALLGKVLMGGVALRPEWLGACELLIVVGVLVFVGLPNNRQLLLLVDENT